MTITSTCSHQGQSGWPPLAQHVHPAAPTRRSRAPSGTPPCSAEVFVEYSFRDPRVHHDLSDAWARACPFSARTSAGPVDHRRSRSRRRCGRRSGPAVLPLPLLPHPVITCRSCSVPHGTAAIRRKETNDDQPAAAPGPHRHHRRRLRRAGRRHPASSSRAPRLRRPRARRRRRRHLAGQHLPGLRLRRPVAPLLVLLRAQPALVEHASPASRRSGRYLRGCADALRHRARTCGSATRCTGAAWDDRAASAG